MSLIAELKRRKVFKVGAAYLVVAWLAVQAASIGFPAFDAPPWALRVFILVCLLGFPLALVVAWIFDASPEGVKLDGDASGNKRVFTGAAVLIVLALGWYFYGQPAFRKSAPAVPAVAATVDKSIAVLPFVNMSDDKQNEYFSDGLSEELLNQLAQSPQLRVIARTSSFSFKGKEVDVATIAKALNVANVLEGSVRKSGNTLRITAQLIRTSDSSHLWSQTYDRELTDVFKIQDEIAGAIAEALEAKLAGRLVNETSARTANPAAYDDYLQGRAFLARRRLENIDKSIAAFERAIAEDPGFSAAYSARGFASFLRPLWGATDTVAALASAKDSADKALQLDPGNAEAYMVRGMAASYRNDYTSAAADLDHALALAPGNGDVVNMHGDFFLSAGDIATSERDKRKAMALDPLAFVHPMNLADALSAQGRYADAAVAVEQAIALGAGDFGYDRLVFYQSRLHRFDAAQAALDKGCALDPASVAHCELNRVQLLASNGQRPQAELKLDAIARGMHKEELSPGGLTASGMTFMYLEVGDVAKATQWQRTTVDVGDWFPTVTLLGQPGGAKLPEEISRDPAWLAAWNDPRLKDVMANYRRNLLAWRACSQGGKACP
jgi:TolB-like protein/Flp pilus assembly protein TadD